MVRRWARHGLPTGERTLADALRDAGYEYRAAIGKWHLGHLEAKWHPLSRGFNHFTGNYNGAVDYWTREREGEIDWHVNATPAQPAGYTTDLIADAAAGYIREHARRGPLLCYVAFTAPHSPLQVPDSYGEKYKDLDGASAGPAPSNKRLLAAMIACLDDGIGRILQAIADQGIADDTLIWFLSDNGGVAGIDGNNAPLRGSKLTVYEGGVRVPAAVWWPGVIEGGRTITAPMSHVDMLPTLLRACTGGAALPMGLDGVDAFEALTGRDDAWVPQRDLYSFTGQNGIEKEQLAILSPDGWKLIIIGPDVRREGGYRTPSHRMELFHLDRDPCETTDRAAQEPERVRALGGNLVAVRRSEPEGAMVPRPTTDDFKPPRHWRNPLADTR